MTEDDRVRVTVDDADGVFERLSLGHRRELHSDGGLDDAAEAPKRRPERQARARARLIEEVREQLTAQQVRGALARRDVAASVRDTEDPFEVAALKLRDREEVLAEEGHGDAVQRSAGGTSRGAPT